MPAHADRTPELSAVPRFEMYAAVALVGVSFLFPESGYKDVLFQLVFVSAVLVAQRLPLMVFIPIPVASIMWWSGFVDKWFLAPIIVYLAVYVTAFRVGITAAVVVSFEWILLAYIVSASPIELESWLYSLILESSLLVFLVFMGSARRNRLSAVRRARELQEQAEKKLLEHLNEYLHDSVAKKLTMMTILADRIREEVGADPERERVGEVAELGRGALRDLEELMRRLTSGVNGLQRSLEGLWSPEPFPRAVQSAVASLRDMGFTIELSGSIDVGALVATVEDALTLSFQEAVVNMTKYASLRSTIRIDMESQYDELWLLLSNVVEYGEPERTSSFSTGSGLSGISSRLESVGGRVSVRSTPTVWTVALVVPVLLEGDRNE